MKWSNYYYAYNKHFPIAPSRIVEIGVNTGSGLKWLRSKYPAAHLIGIDINFNANKFEDSNMTLIKANSCNLTSEDLQKIGMVDIIIDDGGHRPYQQSMAFKRLLPHLNVDGVYAIEDMHLGQRFHWKIFSLFFGISKTLRKLIAEQSKWEGPEAEGIRYPAEILFFPQLVLIKNTSVHIEQQ